MKPQRIAIVGAESTGKSWLTRALAGVMQARGQTVHAVDEVLRAWCEREGRTPLPHEQMTIARQQARAVEHASAGWVISDTTPIMTAVYSHLLFDDHSLFARDPHDRPHLQARQDRDSVRQGHDPRLGA